MVYCMLHTSLCSNMCHRTEVVHVFVLAQARDLLVVACCEVELLDACHFQQRRSDCMHACIGTINNMLHTRHTVSST